MNFLFRHPFPIGQQLLFTKRLEYNTTFTLSVLSAPQGWGGQSDHGIPVPDQRVCSALVSSPTVRNTPGHVKVEALTMLTIKEAGHGNNIFPP
jgi:hypothetical protein